MLHEFMKRKMKRSQFFTKKRLKNLRLPQKQLKNSFSMKKASVSNFTLFRVFIFHNVSASKVPTKIEFKVKTTTAVAKKYV